MAEEINQPWWDTPKEAQTPWWDTPGAAGQERPSAAQSVHESRAADEAAHTTATRSEGLAVLLKWMQRNKHALIYMLIGLSLALGILCIGFWRTVLIGLCLGAGYLLGSWKDGNPQLKQRLDKFIRRWIDDNPFMK